MTADVRNKKKVGPAYTPRDDHLALWEWFIGFILYTSTSTSYTILLLHTIITITSPLHYYTMTITITITTYYYHTHGQVLAQLKSVSLIIAKYSSFPPKRLTETGLHIPFNPTEQIRKSPAFTPHSCASCCGACYPRESSRVWAQAPQRQPCVHASPGTWPGSQPPWPCGSSWHCCGEESSP